MDIRRRELRAADPAASAFPTKDAALMPRTAEDRAQSRWVPFTIGVVALAIFVVMQFTIPGRGAEPLPVDVWWHDLLVGERTDAGVAVAWVPGVVGGTIGMIVIGLALIALFFLLRRRWDALTVALAMIVSIAV